MFSPGCFLWHRRLVGHFQRSIDLLIEKKKQLFQLVIENKMIRSMNEESSKRGLFFAPFAPLGADDDVMKIIQIILCLPRCQNQKVLFCIAMISCSLSAVLYT